jgi:plastocyanin
MDPENISSPENKKSNLPMIIGAIVVLIVVVGVLMMQGKKNSNMESQQSGNNTTNTATLEKQKPITIEGTPAQKPSTNGTAEKPKAAVKEFTFNASNYKYDLKEIKVNKGDTVKIILKNNEGMHDWKVDEFDAATEVIQTGETDTVEFVADKTGSFEFYCSVGQHRANGMKGMLIVQ